MAGRSRCGAGEAERQSWRLDKRLKNAIVILVIGGLIGAFSARADADHCAICGNLFTDKVYIFTDKATGEKPRVCPDCSALREVCFVCGLPVKKDFTHLPDDRYICARDARNAMLNDDEAKEVCAAIRDAMEHLFSRFLTFPATNISVAIVDRVNLLELFKVPGNDYSCPNVLGYISSKPKRGVMRHKISLLGALPRAEFKAVCAHELTHAWQAENVPAARKKTLGADANEAFCELIAYLLLDSQSETEEMKAILRNAYTRGQIDLFIEAEKRFGLNQVVDWMKYGVDSVLHPDDLNNVRNIELPRSNPHPAVSFSPVLIGSRTFNTLILKSIVWSKDHPMATINDRTFEVGNTFKVKLGSSNVTVTCTSIRQNAVSIKVAGGPEEQELHLRTE